MPKSRLHYHTQWNGTVDILTPKSADCTNLISVCLCITHRVGRSWIKWKAKVWVQIRWLRKHSCLRVLPGFVPLRHYLHENVLNRHPPLHQLFWGKSEKLDRFSYNWVVLICLINIKRRLLSSQCLTLGNLTSPVLENFSTCWEFDAIYAAWLCKTPWRVVIPMATPPPGAHLVHINLVPSPSSRHHQYHHPLHHEACSDLRLLTSYRILPPIWSSHAPWGWDGVFIVLHLEY